jgi:hypothetical protein
MYSSGTTGGTGGNQPAPAATLVHPANDQALGTLVDLWADDAAGSEIIDRARFQFSTGADWFDIGFDNVDDPPLRNGVDPSGFGDGLSYRWNTQGLSEGEYQLRTIVSDTLGRADTAQVDVSIDPTPPIPEIVTPVFGQNICDGVFIEAACDDEDITYLTFETVVVPRDNLLPIPLINQYIGGDINGDPADGNLVANGEFGDYCSGPAAAAMAVKYWFNKGYNYLLNESSTILTDTQLVDRMFTAMAIQDNLGAYDEQLIAGLRHYVITHGNELRIYPLRNPSINDLFAWMYDYEYCVLVGMAGDPGFWLTAAGSIEFTNSVGNFQVRMADPKTGTISGHTVKEDGGKAYLFYDGVWHQIDILVGTIGYDWTVTRRTIGVDAVPGDGWGFDWQTTGYSDDSLYIMRTTVYDAGGHTGHSTVALQVDCTVNGIPGDVNHDGLVGIADLVYMVNWRYLDGPPPPGGYGVADVNCDGQINVADVVYLLNYLFNSGPPPCE